MNFKRITVKLLGASMEVVNVTPEKFMAILKLVGTVAVLMVLVVMAPSILDSLANFVLALRK